MERYVLFLSFLDLVARTDAPLFFCLSLSHTLSLANALNLPSVNAAIRLGMRNETPDTIKGHRLLLPGKLGSLPGRAGDVGWKNGGAADEAKPNATGNWSRSTNLLAITYDDWLAGGKERLDGMLVRN